MSESPQQAHLHLAASVPLPLDEQARADIVDMIRREARPASKVDVAALVDMIEQALLYGDPPIADAVLDPAQTSEYNKSYDRLHRSLVAFRARALNLQMELKEFGDVPDRTLICWVNTFSSVIMSCFPLLSGREKRDLAVQFVDTVSKVAAWPEFKAPSKAGRPPRKGPAQQLIRAVGYYLTTVGISPQYTWKRTTEYKKGKRGGKNSPLADADLPPSNATTQLIAVAAKAFRLEATNSELKTEVDKARRYFSAAGMHQPWFD